jgi:hypothetical protein
MAETTRLRARLAERNEEVLTLTAEAAAARGGRQILLGEGCAGSEGGVEGEERWKVERERADALEDECDALREEVDCLKGEVARLDAQVKSTTSNNSIPGTLLGIAGNGVGKGVTSSSSSKRETEIGRLKADASKNAGEVLRLQEELSKREAALARHKVDR